MLVRTPPECNSVMELANFIDQSVRERARMDGEYNEGYYDAMELVQRKLRQLIYGNQLELYPQRG